MVHSGLHLPVKYVQIMFLWCVFLTMFFPNSSFDLKYANKTNKQKTQNLNKQQKTTKQKKTLKLMSLNPASTTGLWLSWVQWKALVKSQMKLAGLPGQPLPCIGMAPTVIGEQAAASGQGQL